ncbi:MAG: GNAT family N-acetyltransferase [Bacteroidales bacterium]|nr:GNAT family N-acetyltransferase [Bacteroidales bacterium]
MILHPIHEKFIVRKYRKGDFKNISSLWQDTGISNPLRGDDENTIKKSIKIGGSLLILEEKNIGRICGTSWMTFDGRRIHLHHFGILPEYQGKGLSKLLLRESVEFARKKGCQIKLEVKRTNKKAIDLYSKAGFEYLGDYDVYILRDKK